MPPLRESLERLLARQDLDESAADELLTCLADPQGSPVLCGAVLVALRAKGVVAAELRGFAQAMRRMSRRPQLVTRAGAVDIVGTGGDASGSLNISTGTALLAAACGIPVVKHGNRSISSRAGSADVLEALGLPMPFDEATAAACFAACGFTFLFAPYYHPCMQTIAPIRAALGIRTVFNVLGPLVNPAEPPFHLIGACDLDTARLMAATLAGLPIERAFVVHGAQNWDEPTPIGPFKLIDVSPGRVQEETRDPGDYGLERCTAECLRGGDATDNARELARVLRGRASGPHRDCLLLGAALALELTGRSTQPLAGIAAAAGAIDSGRAGAWLDSLLGWSRARVPA